MLVGSRNLLLSVVAVLCAYTQVVIAAGNDNKKEILIGQTISYGEKANPYAKAASQGIRLVFDRVNSQGGINGKRIKLLVLDDDAKNDLAEKNARALVDQGAMLLFAPLEGGPATAVAKVADEKGVVLFAPMAGSPVLVDPYRPMVFPVRAMHRTEFVKLLQYAQLLGLKRVAFLHATTPVGLQHLNNMRLEAKALGLELVAELPYTDAITDGDLAALMAKAQSKGAQFIMNHGSPKVFERAVLTSKKISYYPQFLGVNSGSSEVAKRLGPQSVGVVFSQVTPNPASDKFAVVREYKANWAAAYPGTPFSHGGLEGYINAKALVVALKRSAPDFTTQSFIKGLYAKPIPLGGLDLRYSPAAHAGMSFVDTSFVRADGSFSY
jgi:branched-chain amino acid transport system substrate-binding protein